jgi:uncharacterized protein YprB with RNaseH-like and TPR domain
MSPLEQSLLHLPHVGPKRAAQLAAAGCGTWSAIVAAAQPVGMSASRWDEVQAEARRCLAAVAADDPRPLAQALASREQWRVLAHWFDQASFFDIETSGLEPESEVTLVVCLHRGRLHHFLKGENLDDFLALLDEVKLLVSFNGAGFDVPRIEDRFHIPKIPCAHVDLRWLCHHRGWQGGLKSIEQQLGLHRPADLQGLGGAQAVWLWQVWQERHSAAARRTLERYCAADVVALQLLAAELLAAHGCAVTVPSPETLWELVHAQLPPPDAPVPLPAPAVAAPPAPHTTLGARPDPRAIAAAAAPVLSREEKQKRLRELWRSMRSTSY